MRRPRKLKLHPRTTITAVIVALAAIISLPAISSATTPPPTITSPSPGATDASGTITVSGTATAGAAVTLYDAGTDVGDVTADPTTGVWTVSVPAAIGAHTFTATQTIASVISADSSTLTVNELPTAPTITAPAATNTTATFTLTGTEDASATVTLYDNATASAATITYPTTTTWSATLTAVPVGHHAYTATQTEPTATTVASPATETSALSTTATVDELPTTPVITTSAFANTTGAFAIAGNAATAGDELILYDNGSEVAATTATTANWSFSLTNVPVGAHNYTIAQALSGATSTPSAPLAVAEKPLAPVITSVPASPTTAPSITLSGTSNTTATIDLYDAGPAGSAPGTFLAEATTTNGVWSIPVTATVGHHLFYATQVVNGETSATTASPITIDVEPPAPAITLPTPTSDDTTAVTISGNNATPGATITLYDQGNPLSTTAIAVAGGGWSIALTNLAVGAHSYTATQSVARGTANAETSPASGSWALAETPPTVTITSPTTDATTAPTITGTGADAGATVSLWSGGVQVGPSETASPSGAWQIPLSAVTIGVHRYTATETLDGETATASSALTLTELPPAPAITSPASGGTDDTASFTLSGTANAGASVTVDDGGSVLATTTANATTGAWSVTALAVSRAVHTYTATQSLDGETSAASAAVTVDEVAPPLAPVTTPVTTPPSTTSSVTVSTTLFSYIGFAQHAGKARYLAVAVNVPDPGTLQIRARHAAPIGLSGFPTSQNGNFTWGYGSYKFTRAGRHLVVLIPTAQGTALTARESKNGRPLHLRLWLTFTATGGAISSQSSYVAIIAGHRSTGTTVAG